MESSLSSVPPVWPRPRPEIIGTKAPQAAAIGASIRLTLSPTPPLECLSITGPGSLRSLQSSVTPECFRPIVSATRSPTVMPRKNTAIAKAATWPSLRLPSAMPRATKAISAALSASPLRLRRMISFGSIGGSIGSGETFEEGAQQAIHRPGGLAGDSQRLLVRELPRHQARGIIGEQRHGRDLHAGMARQDRLGRGRHADRRRTQRDRGANLGRRL